MLIVGVVVDMYVGVVVGEVWLLTLCVLMQEWQKEMFDVVGIGL